MYFDIIGSSLFDEGDKCPRYLSSFCINLLVLFITNLPRRFSKISNCAHVCRNNPKTRVSVPTFMIVTKITVTICWMDVIQNIRDVL